MKIVQDQLMSISSD